MKSQRLVIVRHGRTAYNEEGRFQGQLDIGLDDLGREQAARAGREIAMLAPTAIVTSDSSRASDTAAQLAAAAGIDAVIEPRLREVDLGTWSGLTRDEVKERHPDEYAAWRSGQDVARGGGETYAQVADRAAAAVSFHLARLAVDATLVVVTHGGTSRALAGHLLGLPMSDWWRLAVLGNTRRSVLLGSDRGWRLLEYNA